MISYIPSDEILIKLINLFHCMQMLLLSLFKKRRLTMREESLSDSDNESRSR